MPSLPAETLPDAVVPCKNCFEPSVATDGKLLYLAVGGELTLHRFDGAFWSGLPGPSSGMPGGGDTFVQTDARGRVWMSSLVGFGVVGGSAMLVARSDDHGGSWPVDQDLFWGPADSQMTGIDRNWLAVDNDTVVAACTCPAIALPQVRVSRDGGTTFGPPLPIAAAGGRPGPLGPLVFGPNDVLVAPFLVGADPGTAASAAGVSVVVSHDLGQSWTRIDLVPPERGLAAGGIACCVFPNAAGDGHGFSVAWVTASGDVQVATSPDGTRWSLGTVGQAGKSPHPWPLRLPGDGAKPATVWLAINGTMQASGEGWQSTLGTVPSSPGDFVAATFYRGRIVSAWPDEGGVRVASAMKTT